MTGKLQNVEQRLRIVIYCKGSRFNIHSKDNVQALSSTPGHCLVTESVWQSNVTRIILVSYGGLQSKRGGGEMKESKSLLVKWCVFWHMLGDLEKLCIMRMVGYRGSFPSTGVSALLVARLLRLALKGCHKHEAEK